MSPIGSSQGTGFPPGLSARRAGGRVRNTAFTLIEVLLAAVILSIGLVGVIRSYITLMNGIEAARFTVEASFLLKEKMSDVEKKMIENPGVFPGPENGVFPGYEDLRWESRTGEVQTGVVIPEEGPKWTLMESKVSAVTGLAERSRKLSFYTYMLNPSE